MAFGLQILLCSAARRFRCHGDSELDHGRTSGDDTSLQRSSDAITFGLLCTAILVVYRVCMACGTIGRTLYNGAAHLGACRKEELNRSCTQQIILCSCCTSWHCLAACLTGEKFEHATPCASTRQTVTVQSCRRHRQDSFGI